MSRPWFHVATSLSFFSSVFLVRTLFLVALHVATLVLSRNHNYVPTALFQVVNFFF